MSSWIVAANDKDVAVVSTIVYCDTELEARVDGAAAMKVSENAVTVRRLDDGFDTGQ